MRQNAESHEERRAVGDSKLTREDQDHLTGIWKRDIAGAKIASRMRGRRGGALFLCDVDHMRQINAQYGHLSGDRCLQQVAQILSYMIRPDDILGRYGGDEFVIFMSECQDTEQAQEICRRIQDRFRKTPFSLTIVWVLRGPGDTCEKLSARADEELQRKKGGAVLSGTHSDRKERKEHYIKDVYQVRKELIEQIQKPGAYCQDYETFKSIYRFLERGIIRSGQDACVILITVVDNRGGSPLLHEKDALMERLGQDIESTLRIGDVYTRYSSSQYLLLVIDTTKGQADRIVDRIRERFLAGRQGNDVLIHHCYKLQPARVGKMV